MAQDFSDPLTSATYTSPRIVSGHDPLLAFPSTIAPISASVTTKQQTDALTSTSTSIKATSSSIAQSTSDSLSPPSSKKQIPQNYSTTTKVVRQKALSSSSTPTPSSSSSSAAKPPATGAIANSLSEVSSFSSPSSPLSRPFSDPLRDDSTSENYSVYPKHNSYTYNKASHVNSDHSINLPVSPNVGPITSSRNYAYNTPNSSMPSSPSSTPVASSQKPVLPSSPSTSIRPNPSYDQQRARAPQYLHITFQDTDRRGKDGMFVLSAQTNMPRFRRQSYQNIMRSYVEFVRLREHLVAEHPEVIVPALPPERSLVSASDIESMRLFVERISHHPTLSQDYELQMFIESEFGFLPPAKPKKILGKLLNIGVKRFSSGGGTVASLDDTDDEFEEEKTVASKMETKLQTVIKCLDKEIKARRDFSSKESELATLSNAWAANESSPEMARLFKLLSKPLDGMAKTSKAQVGGDATVLGSFLEYKLQHVQTLGNALDYRMSVLSEYDAAIKSTESKRKTMERLRSSTNINPEKATDSIDDFEDAALFEGNMKKRVEQISEALNKDLRGYKQQSQEDLLRALQQYSQRQIGFERAKLEELLSVGAGLYVDKYQGEATDYSQHLP
ncbi:Vacuolar protein sorting-associated protein 17 [Lobosporangium transversale]|uniref:Vps5 C terminal like-domain-containing protein n=1 Tax=Lobosporangium transversale TaxID=64571 RepID=A0A1Y2GBP1_9FUNG|nr:Vps5 C terminal like-domain-containing protein [Lobosporangium transversale]KAF9915356.1 Vacuolar protein sorting-associated protein 17 [Lobosporangium transversale]ORZ06395.1 Vps5 C terminal like-domain-containing protein [Lobosporangium transversale]|eukprot:XP_021877558.1 Vps5 C terminal like-domain-containing protein [Lobosporangium transversale]